ncbi:MAG: FHA domain-containing protein [Lachnospiraceae bacterium]|nr:FHA domain-containing protein [Lachnospiraceae bacterium]
MNIIRCTNGHFFDRETYETCPHCGAPAAGAGQTPSKGASKTPSGPAPAKASHGGFSILGFGKKKEAASPAREVYGAPEKGAAPAAPAVPKNAEYDPGTAQSGASAGGVFVEPAAGRADDLVQKTVDIYGLNEQKEAAPQTPSQTPVSAPPVHTDGGYAPSGVSYDLAAAAEPAPQPAPAAPVFSQPQSIPQAQPAAPVRPEPPVYAQPQPVPAAPVFSQPQPMPQPAPAPQPAPEPAPAPAPAPAAPSLQEVVQQASANEEGKTMSYFSAVAGAKTAAAAALQTPAQESGAGQGAFAAPSGPADPVVGWLVCVRGHNFGRSYPICAGKNSIGRSTDNRVVLAGETSVSRQKHAIIVYEPRHRDFYLQPGDASGLTYLNDEYLMEMKKLSPRDRIDLGDARFIFVPLCGDDFTWEDYL